MSRLFVVATPIGNLSDLSPRALEVLGGCDFILCEDTRRTLKLLTHFGIKKPLVSYHEHNERSRAKEVIARMTERNADAALVSDAGTPCVSDPGYAVVAAAREAGIEVIGVSGPSALVTALSVSGFEAPEFVFCGFPPRVRGERAQLFERMKRAEQPVFVLYESPKRVRALLHELAEAFPGAEICACCDLTKLHEKTVAGPVEQVRDALDLNPNAELGEYALVLKKSSASREAARSEISPHALLVDYIVKHPDSTLNDAVRGAQKEGVSKNALYAASLELKRIRW